MAYQRDESFVTIQQVLLVTGWTPTYATWNPSDKSADVTLSNSDLTAACLHGSAVRATQGVNAGKWYWEITVDATNSPRIGVANSSMTLSTPVGGDTNSWGYSSSGFLLHNNSSIDSGASYAAGSVISIALDMDAGTLTIYKDGVSEAAASSLTGTLYPAVSNSGSSTTSTFTANFGATAFAYTPPSGHQALYY